MRFGLVFIFLSLLLASCHENLIQKNIDEVFGYWVVSQIVYSNAVSSYDGAPNYEIYQFTSEYVSNINNISNYLGYIYEIVSFVTTDKIVSNSWGVDLNNNKMYIYTDSTNYTYTFFLVANNSSNVNEIWLSDGVFSLSNTNYQFFASNGIIRYVLKRK